MADETYTLGALAKRADVNVETLRYYQRRGLLPVPQRVHGERRRYGDEVLQRLLFIRRAQRLGFSLDEIETLLFLKGANRCRDASRVARAKLADLAERLEDLKAMQRSLDALVARCDARDSSDCALIASLFSANAPL